MKKLWLVAVAGLALSASTAFAADLGRPYVKAPPPPPPPPPSWTGFYIGINGGGGWNNNGGALFCQTAVVCPEATGNILKPSGGLFGGQIGFNWQSGIVVWGVEADIQWADIKDSKTVAIDNLDFDASQKLDWFGTARGRIGITPWSQNALLYVTGGAIFGEEKTFASVETISPPFFFAENSFSQTRAGGTVGGGLEYLFTPNLSAKIEGLWYSMGHETLDIVQINRVPTAARFNYEGVIVRAGLNWHFNWGGNYGPVGTQY